MASDGGEAEAPQQPRCAVRGGLENADSFSARSLATLSAALSHIGWSPELQRTDRASCSAGAALLWTNAYPTERQQEELPAGCWVNHLPGAHVLSEKDLFADAMVSTGLTPLTFVLPRDLGALAARAAEHPLWIIKPGRGGGGKGVVVASAEEVRAAASSGRWPGAEGAAARRAVCSAYVSRPLLVQGRKSHIRLWVLRTSTRAWVCREGLLCLAAKAYSADGGALRDPLVHLTNPDVRKRLSAGDGTAPLSRCSELLPPEGWAAVWHGCRRAAAACVAAAPAEGRQRLRCFELLGLDLLVDADLRVWVLECNTNPDLTVPPAAGPGCAHRVKLPMLRGALATVGLAAEGGAGAEGGAAEAAGLWEPLEGPPLPPPRPPPTPAAAPAAAAVEGPGEGVVLSWNPRRGYGFIRADAQCGGGDVFLHISAAPEGVGVGARLRYRAAAQGPGRTPAASQVRLLSDPVHRVDPCRELQQPAAAAAALRCPLTQSDTARPAPGVGARGWGEAEWRRFAAVAAEAGTAAVDVRKCRMGPANWAALLAELYHGDRGGPSCLFAFNNVLGSDGVRALARLPVSCSLVKLNLCTNDISDSCAEELGELLGGGSLRGLQRLDLNRNSVADRGAAALAAACARGCALQHLSLMDNRIGQPGGAALLRDAAGVLHSLRVGGNLPGVAESDARAITVAVARNRAAAAASGVAPDD